MNDTITFLTNCSPNPNNPVAHPNKENIYNSQFLQGYFLTKKQSLQYFNLWYFSSCVCVCVCVCVCICVCVWVGGWLGVHLRFSRSFI